MRSVEASAIDPASRYFHGDEGRFRDMFNRTAFSFSHSLSRSHLFELPRLIQLVRSLPREELHYDAGDIRINQRWDQAPPCELSAVELIDRIENAGAWIIIRRAQKDPEYREILDRCLAEAEDLVGIDLGNQTKVRDAIVFITSPGRISSYHIDRECNFLLQVQGEKVIYIFDKNDREVLPEQEIERFWTVDNNAAVYKEQFQNRAQAFHLKPDVGVHIPVNAPHWVQNANNVSVTVAMTFQFHDRDLANVYRANYLIRKIGLVPLPPGRSRARDRMKSSAIDGAIKMRRAWRRLRGA